MPNDTPGRDAVPGWGQPAPVPPPDEPAVPGPEEPGPADVPWPVEADAPVAPDAPTAPWPSTPDPAPPPVAPWGATPAQPAAPAPVATAPAAPTTWGAPAQPAAPAPVATAPAAPAQAGTWGAQGGYPTPQQPPVPPQQPPAPQPAPGAWAPPPSPSGPSWGPPAGQQPPGAWGAPPPQGGWTPGGPGGPGGPGTPGGPPVGWAPAPAKSSNGCLKGCLIVGAIGIVLLIILFIAISILGVKFAQDLGVGPDGKVAQCSLVSNADLASVLGGDAQAMPLGGIVDATIGQLLDKRVIPDAEDCWIVGSNAGTGRIARQSGGDASGAFRAAKDAAKSGGYFAGDASGIGDEAFCTGSSEAFSFGALVRSGDKLVYVSLIGADASSSTNFETNADGVVTSPETCKLAQEVARKVLR